MSTAPASQATSEDVTFQFVGFRLGEQEYAFPIDRVQEIVVLGDVTPVPQVEEHVEGVTNLRGHVVPVIDLRRLYGLPPGERPGTHAIIVNVGEKHVGCRVDSVTEVLRIRGDEIQPAPEVVVGAGEAHVTGFLKYRDRLVVACDSGALLSADADGPSNEIT